jgi:hypothetical protein
MRGADITQESLFTVAKLDDFVPASHPLRTIRKLADTALQRMSALFDTLAVLLAAQRANADATAGLQPAVPLVRRPGH